MIFRPSLKLKMVKQHSHKANSAWKQQNKSHKTGKHASKRSVNLKGQETILKNKVAAPKKGSILTKKDRKNAAKLKRIYLNRNDGIENGSSNFNFMGSVSDIHSMDSDNFSSISNNQSSDVFNSVKYISILPLHSRVDMQNMATNLLNFITKSPDCANFKAESFNTDNPYVKIIKTNISKQKIVLSAIDLFSDAADLHIFDVLDVLRMTDQILFVADADEAALAKASQKLAGKLASGSAEEIGTIDDQGIGLLELLVAQKLPNWSILINDYQANLTPRMENNLKTLTLKCLEKYLPIDKNTYSKNIAVTSKSSNLVNLLRGIFQSTVAAGVSRHLKKIDKKSLSLTNRCQMMAMKVNLIENDDQPDVCNLEMTGYLRNCDLNINSAIYISKLGAYNIDCIKYQHDPTIPQHKIQNTNYENGEVVMTSDKNQQSDLVPLAEVDPMDAEQTWPDQEEIDMAENQAAAAVKMTLAGETSQNLGNWMAEQDQNDDDDEDFDDDENEDENSEDLEDDSPEDLHKLVNAASAVAKKKQNPKIQFMNQDQVRYFSENDMIEAKNEKIENAEDTGDHLSRADLEKERQIWVDRVKDYQSHQMFEDELDTPIFGGSREISKFFDFFD